MTPIDRVLAELRDRGDVKRTSKGWRACCPAHDDSTPSLDIDEGTDGTVLLCCRSRRCSVVNITHALGLEVSDLFNRAHVDRMGFDDRIQTTYDYTDEAGKVLFQAVRLWDAKKGKDFRQRRPDGKGGWIWDLKDTRRVLYRLPELLASSGRVFVVEGEKDVENLRKLGLTATTNPMGAGKWKPDYAEHLRSRDVVILPDNDEPGRQHARDVAASCHVDMTNLPTPGGSVKVLALPDLPDKGDVSDWLKAGGTAAQLEEMADAAPEWDGKKYAAPHKSRWPDPVPISSLTGAAADVEWLWYGCIAKRHVTLFSALMKCGKSTLLGCLLRALQEGKSFAGRVTRKCKTLLVSEESAAIWRRRRDDLGLDDSLSVMCRPMKVKPTFGDWADFLAHVKDKATGFDHVVFDTISAFAPWENENASAEIQGTVTPLNQLTEAGTGVTMFHHFGKTDGSEGRAARGSTALAAAVDVLLEMRRFKPDDRDDRRRVLSGLGRFEEVPGEIVIAFAKDGSGYTAEGDKHEVAARELHEALKRALPLSEDDALKADEIHALLPPDGRPQRSAVSAALSAGMGNGWTKTGTGKRGDPFRFWRAVS